MGRRYRAILDHLKINWGVIDAPPVNPSLAVTFSGFNYTVYTDYDKFIIATPTDTHLTVCQQINEQFRNHGKPLPPILCEKPILMPTQFAHLDGVAAKFPNIFMVNNYHYALLGAIYEHLGKLRPLDDHLGKLRSETSYSFYNHGPHSVEWDCIQIIYLAAGAVRFDVKAPVWQCIINGYEVTRSELDAGFVTMVRDFCDGVTGDLWGMTDILSAHAKVLSIIEGKKNGK